MKLLLERRAHYAALKVIVIYALFAAIWIYLSDEALGLFTRNTDIIVRISVFKGFLFIVVTAAILYKLITRQIRKTMEVENDLSASRNLMNAVLKGTTDAIFVKDREGRYLLFNAAAEAVTGKAAEEVLGKDDTDLFPADEAKAVMTDDRRVMDSGRVMTYVDYLTVAGGTSRTFLSTKGPVLDEDSEVSGIFGISRDITERDRADIALRESEKRYRSLFENMQEGYAHCRMLFDDWGKPADFVYLDVNEAFSRLTGLGDVIGKRVSEVIPQVRELSPELFEIYGRVAATGIPEKFEINFTPLRKWFSVSAYSPERDHFVTVFDNITERIQAQENLFTTIEVLRICNEAGSKRDLMKELTEFFQKLTGCDSVGARLKAGDDFPYYETRGFPEEFVLAENSLCSHDDAGGLQRDGEGNPFCDCMCGNIISGRFDPAKPYFTSHGSFWTNSTTELLAATSDKDRLARTRNRCNGEGYESVALVPLRSGGETFGLFQFNDRRSGRFTAEKIALLESLVAPVAISLAKLQVDEALVESNEFNRQVTQRLRLATASGQLGIWDWDIAYDVLVWNERMFELYGVSKDTFLISRKTWEKCLHPDDLAMALEMSRAALSGEKEYDFEFRIVHPGGGTKFIKTNGLIIRDEAGNALRMIGMNQDITERKHLEEQLRQAQKMEAIGQLAGGVAHDFNNILTAIYGYCSVLQMKMGTDSPFRADIDHIYAAAERAANLTRSLLAFSRKQIMSPQKVNMNDIVMNLGKLLTRIIGEDIRLKMVCMGVPLRIYADSGQIEQVLMNLAANARDAMPNGGTLTIETGIQEIDDGFIRTYGYGDSGKFVVLSVSDTGKGIDAETRKKIFEPFFTTKEVGKGTGLGLSIVYGVIKQHNGYINVFSEPGRGTTFSIYLPWISEEDVDDVEESGQEYPRMGSGTVLVAEDDANIRELAESVLKKFGYDVILARDGADAVEKFKAHGDHIAIVVMDMIMPKKSGREAYEEIRSIRADTKILFMSGYSPELLHDRGVFDSSFEVLIKPIHPLDLVRKVGNVLDGRNN